MVRRSMTQTYLLSILGTGFAVAFLHSAIPTHWLPFVLAARAQGWTRARTLGVTAFAGAGHVALTTLLGVVVVVAGVAVDQWTGIVFPWIAGGLLSAFGLFYIIRQIRGQGGHHHGHGHSHGHGDEQGNHGHIPRSDRATVMGLFTMLTFSPCEGFLPVYLSGVKYGWGGFALLSLILGLGVLAGMLLFTWLTLVGSHRLKLVVLEEYESGIVGVLLVALGLLIVTYHP